MTAPAPAPRLPFERPNALDLAPLLARLREQGPITRVTTPAGDPAWLVTRYEEAREVLSDTRFSRQRPDTEDGPRISTSALHTRPAGTPEEEDREHARMRRMLAPAFSAPRMRRLGERIGELAESCLDSMEAQHARHPDRAVDLHEHLSFRLPVMVICELLGVPVADRDLLRGWSERIAALYGGEDAAAAMAEFEAYVAAVAEDKRERPGQDVFSDILAVQAQDPSFTEQEMTRLAVGLLFAGHETTSARIDLGVLFLLGDTARRDRFAADPQGTARATVEEILRMAAPGGLGLTRFAREDLTVAGTAIARGEAVLVAINAANRDARAFEEPDAFDPSRSPNAHLAFGHGGHYCIGNSLARTELQTALTALFRRFPGLRPAVDPHSLRDHSERLAGGLGEVPVRWW
ncbi:cytochrome P450 [Kitasatospora sp. NPDC094011]|uniref:cytochrome P450 n=1 Tax=Kitasatospora sp. NPDC094011 TaxID=3364090 RepID=UPI0038007D9A